MALSPLFLSKSLPANEAIPTLTHSLPSPASTLLHFPSKPTCQNPQKLSNKALLKQCERRITSTKTRVSFFPSFLTKSKDAKALKEELLEAIEPLDRGADASPEDQQRIDEIARKLEGANPTREPLKSNLLNGKWELIYTTSQSILQTQRPRFLRSRTNYQAINLDTLRAQNMESGPFFNQVTADLTPLNSRKVAVKFDYFRIGGLIPIKAPGRARGELEITYLDEDFRVSRGDKGNLFVLKMVDPSYRVPS